MNTWKVILATLVIFITGLVTGGLLVSYADRASQKGRRFLPRETVRLPGNATSSPMGFPRDPRDSQPRLPNPPNPQARVPRVLNMEFLLRLDSEVHLAPEQRERIEKIISDGQLRNKEIMKPVAPELQREMMETQKRIREELTPDQRTRWEELMKQRQPRRNDEPMQPGMRPRDQRRPLPPNGERQPDGAPQPPDGKP